MSKTSCHVALTLENNLDKPPRDLRPLLLQLLQPLLVQLPELTIPFCNDRRIPLTRTQHRQLARHRTRHHGLLDQLAVIFVFVRRAKTTRFNEVERIGGIVTLKDDLSGLGVHRGEVWHDLVEEVVRVL